MQSYLKNFPKSCPFFLIKLWLVIEHLDAVIEKNCVLIIFSFYHSLKMSELINKPNVDCMYNSGKRNAPNDSNVPTGENSKLWLNIENNEHIDSVMNDSKSNIIRNLSKNHVKSIFKSYWARTGSFCINF